MTTDVQFIHPETGVLLAEAEDFQRSIVDVEERLRPLYRLRAVLQEAYAARFPMAAIPERRRRTDKQELMARCPRCGQSYQDAA